MTYHEVIRPESISGEVFDYLLARGWYPMRQMIFTTSHLESPDGTVSRRVRWLRYPVAAVTERKSHRRIRRNAVHLLVELAEPFTHCDELDELYQRYLDSIEFDGYPSVAGATFSPDEQNIYDSRAFLVRDGDRVVACGIFHTGTVSAASILHFYDPEYSRYSLGKYLILLTLEYCRLKGIQWYYPGYVVVGDPRMDYKLFLGQDLAQYYSPLPHPMEGRWLTSATNP